jgi:hypothetical protein
MLANTFEVLIKNIKFSNYCIESNILFFTSAIGRGLKLLEMLEPMLNQIKLMVKPKKNK